MQILSVILYFQCTSSHKWSSSQSCQLEIRKVTGSNPAVTKTFHLEEFFFSLAACSSQFDDTNANEMKHTFIGHNRYIGSHTIFKMASVYECVLALTNLGYELYGYLYYISVLFSPEITGLITNMPIGHIVWNCFSLGIALRLVEKMYYAPSFFVYIY